MSSSHSHFLSQKLSNYIVTTSFKDLPDEAITSEGRYLTAFGEGDSLWALESSWAGNRNKSRVSGKCQLSDTLQNISKGTNNGADYRHYRSLRGSIWH